MISFLALALALAIIFAFLLIVFVAFIYPVWALIDCVVTPVLETKWKIIWSIVMVVFWPLGSFAYGLFGSRKKIFQWIVTISLVVSFIFGLFFVTGLNWLIDTTVGNIDSQISGMERLEPGPVSKEELMKLNTCLLSLEGEMHDRWYSFDKKLKAMHLLDFFETITSDHHITREEYTEWMKRFESRETADRQTLENRIKEFKARPAPAKELPPGIKPGQMI